VFVLEVESADVDLDESSVDLAHGRDVLRCEGSFDAASHLHWTTDHDVDLALDLRR
jgi:hypothetical protein